MALPAALTTAELEARIRVPSGSSTGLDDIQAFARAQVLAAAPGAPDAIQQVAIIAMVAYLFDRPHAAPGNQFANVWRNSGAAMMLRQWVRRSSTRLGDGGEAGGGEAGGETGTPLDLSAIAAWAHAANNDPIPVEKLANALAAVTAVVTAYIGTSDDGVPEPDELTIEAVRGAATLPSYVGNKRILLARLATEDDIDRITADSDTVALGAFTKYANTVIPTGDTREFNVWVSNQALINGEDSRWVISGPGVNLANSNNDSPGFTVGSGAPSDADGLDGNVYLRYGDVQTPARLYIKAAGAWVLTYTWPVGGASPGESVEKTQILHGELLPAPQIGETTGEPYWPDHLGPGKLGFIPNSIIGSNIGDYYIYHNNEGWTLYKKIVVAEWSTLAGTVVGDYAWGSIGFKTHQGGNIRVTRDGTPPVDDNRFQKYGDVQIRADPASSTVELYVRTSVPVPGGPARTEWQLAAEWPKVGGGEVINAVSEEVTMGSSSTYNFNAADTATVVTAWNTAHYTKFLLRLSIEVNGVVSESFTTFGEGRKLGGVNRFPLTETTPSFREAQLVARPANGGASNIGAEKMLLVINGTPALSIQLNSTANGYKAQWFGVK